MTEVRPQARSLHFIQYGAEHVAKSLSIRGGSNEVQWEPIIGAVIETDAGWVVFDTGMSRAAFSSPAIAAAYGAGSPAHAGRSPRLDPLPPDGAEWAWLAGADPLEAGLASVGLEVADLSLAVISHLHVDHSGGIPTLASHGVPIAIQARELAFARSGRVAESAGFHPPDWQHPDTRWIELDGDGPLAPGVSAISTPGHTPGHMSLLVELPGSGAWLLAADAADLGENFLDQVPCGSAAGGTAADEADADRSLGRLFDVAHEHRARIIPGHDQIVVTAVRHPLGGHR